MVVHANSTDARAGQPPRVGFVVSKAVGNAVVRNRTKRVLRALMRARIAQVPDGRGCNVKPARQFFRLELARTYAIASGVG